MLRLLLLVGLIAILGTGLGGCGKPLEKVGLDDPRVRPLLSAMNEVDRATLGFTAISTNEDLRLESWSGNYDAALHAYGEPSRMITFRKTQSGYRWISEQETYQGPKWLLGPTRESISIQYQREPLSDIPTNQIWIHYSGDDSKFSGRELTLQEVRPVLEVWKTTPLEPSPSGLEDFNPGLGIYALIVILVFFLTCVFACFICLLCFVLTMGFLAAGVISVSVVAGLLGCSVSSGFRALFLQLGALGGLLFGILVTWGLLWMHRLPIDSPWRWLLGAAIGAVIGLFGAWVFNKMWSFLAKQVTRKLENR